MWVFTETGFVSAVRKPEEPKYITVRAREKQSLEVLAVYATSPFSKCVSFSANRFSPNKYC